MGELTVLARLGQNSTREQLRAELVSAAQRIPQLEPVREQVAVADVVGLQEALTGHVRPAMLATFGAVALVLLIACANVANLMLARAQGRRGELGVRSAMGADRGRIARQLLTECAVLAAAAAALGVGAAWALLPRVLPLLPPELGVSGASIQLDGAALFFVAGALMVTLVATGLLPALRSSTGLSLALTGSRSGIGGGRRANRTTHALVVGELAVAALLASTAGLLLKSFSRLTDVDVGFSPQGVLTTRIAPSDQRYRDTELRRSLYERTLAEVRALPGVEAAGAIHFLPIAEGGPAINFVTDPADPASRQSTGYRVVTPGYLETMRIPVLEGRDVSETDRAGSTPVGLVNRALADRLWPGADPLGEQVYRTSGRVWFTVVGVTGNIRQSALGLPPSTEAYLPLAQSDWASAMTIVVRSSGTNADLARSVEEIVWSVDPQVPITRSASMVELMSASVASPRFYSALFSLFAFLAVTLGAIGIYGVISSTVRQRTDEIGIRLALGATGGKILTVEIGRAARITAIGIAIGLVGALASSRMLGTLLYEVSPFDLGVFTVAAIVLSAVALLSALIPARRAARMDPLASLRGDCLESPVQV